MKNLCSFTHLAFLINWTIDERPATDLSFDEIHAAAGISAISPTSRCSWGIRRTSNRLKLPSAMPPALWKAAKPAKFACQTAASAWPWPLSWKPSNSSSIPFPPANHNRRLFNG